MAKKETNLGHITELLSIQTVKRENPIYTIPAGDLSDRAQMGKFLAFYQEQIKGQDLQISATYFAASWRELCTALLYLLSLTNKGPDVTLGNLTVQVEVVNHFPRVFFVLNQPDEQHWPELVDGREGLLEKVLGPFIQGTLLPVMVSMAAVSGLPVTQLWTQLPLGIEYYIGYLAAHLEASPEQRDKLKEDYDFLIHKLGPQWFGLKRNPFDLKPIYVDDPYRPGEQIRMKPTCCLAYRANTGHGYCYNCPKLTKSQREAKYAEIRAAATQ